MPISSAGWKVPASPDLPRDKEIAKKQRIGAHRGGSEENKKTTGEIAMKKLPIDEQTPSLPKRTKNIKLSKGGEKEVVMTSTSKTEMSITVKPGKLKHEKVLDFLKTKNISLKDIESLKHKLEQFKLSGDVKRDIGLACTDLLRTGEVTDQAVMSILVAMDHYKA